MSPRLLPLAALLPLALLGGCATAPNTQGLGGADYSRAQARSAAQVEFGVVEAIRQVRIDAAQPGHAQGAIAPAIGAIAGGALGSTIGSGDGQRIALVLGALAGGAAGQAVQRARNEVEGVEITVRLQNRVLAVTQADEGLGLRVGDRVRVISDRQTYRVAPAAPAPM